MQEMRGFDVSNNKLTGVIHPDLFTNWAEITSFHAQTNSLTGSIPPEISNATKLQSLLLYNKQVIRPNPSGWRQTDKPVMSVFRVEFPEWANSQFSCWEHGKACM